MKPDYTHVTVLLDRTGSMDSIRDDTIGGFNAFLEGQKAAPGTATLTLVQFDTQDPYEVIHRFKPIGEVPALTRDTYVPRASTPLLDAMGRAINDLEECLSKLPEGDRPASVVVAVVTDGKENSSREFRRDQVAKMIKERTEKDGWQFVFLSADMDAIQDARGVGIDPDAILKFAKTSTGTAKAWSELSEGTADVRAGRKRKIGFRPDTPPKGEP